jgi:hypothetical protein
VSGTVFGFLAVNGSRHLCFYFFVSFVSSLAYLRRNDDDAWADKRKR